MSAHRCPYCRTPLPEERMEGSLLWVVAPDGQGIEAVCNACRIKHDLRYFKVESQRRRASGAYRPRPKKPPEPPNRTHLSHEELRELAALLDVPGHERELAQELSERRPIAVWGIGREKLYGRTLRFARLCGLRVDEVSEGNLAELRVGRASRTWR